MTYHSLITKQLAQGLVEAMLYVPRGMILPVVDFLDMTREILLHDNIICAYCEKKHTLPKASRNKFCDYTNKYFISVYFALYKINLKLLMLLTQILSLLISDEKMDHLLKAAEKLKTPLDQIRRFLLKNHNNIVWYGIGMLFLFAFAMLWGWGIIPEIYISSLASSWGGKIINHGANLLIRRQYSDEWLFLKNSTDYFFGKKPHLQSKKEVKMLLKKIILEFSIITILGRFSQFIDYCFKAFFSSLLFYMLIKAAAEEAPQMIYKVEQQMSDSVKAKDQYHFENILWIISYKLFKANSSSRAQNRYNSLHQQIHQQKNVPQACRI